MNRVYRIYLGDRLIGTTQFEHADAPMGVVFGKIEFIPPVGTFSQAALRRLSSWLGTEMIF